VSAVVHAQADSTHHRGMKCWYSICCDCAHPWDSRTPKWLAARIIPTGTLAVPEQEPVRPLPDLLGEALRNRRIWLELVFRSRIRNQFERFTQRAEAAADSWWERFRTVAWQAI